MTMSQGDYKEKREQTKKQHFERNAGKSENP